MDTDMYSDLSRLQEALKSSPFRVPALVALESLSPLRGLASGFLPILEPMWNVLGPDSYMTAKELLSSEKVYGEFMSALERD